MADGTDGPSMRGRTEDASGERETSVFADFVDAARSAAESLLDEQKQQVAGKVSGIAEALRSAAHSLQQSQNRTIAEYVDQAADRVESISRAVGERSWTEIAADAEDFARRQPTLFALGAVAAGFLVGRFLWVSTGELRDRKDQLRKPRGASNDTIVAAVSSGRGAGVAEVTVHTTVSSGVVEDR
jgi:ElaB/YqjD/DUF883 family membrane-anchored ribosome-binding protein